MIIIEHLNSPLKGAKEFDRFPIEIGREPKICQICYPPDYRYISRKHAKIHHEEKIFRLEDSSTNGTYVDGKKVDNIKIKIKENQVIQFSQNGPEIIVKFMKSTLGKNNIEERNRIDYEISSEVNVFDNRISEQIKAIFKTASIIALVFILFVYIFLA